MIRVLFGALDRLSRDANTALSAKTGGGGHFFSREFLQHNFSVKLGEGFSLNLFSLNLGLCTQTQ